MTFASYKSTASVASSVPAMDEAYDYTAGFTTTNNNNNSNDNEEDVDGEEALLDLAQLEELQQEADKMKGLGNKHMAAQEYTKAYNAYSAALQLAPVGPSSHVYLSNRAAALLSLKRYDAAAKDAKRAVALAPTFAKAHARLGQALYFLKEYPKAIQAYEEALHYEPDNTVTQTYLGKAKSKFDKLQRAQGSNNGGSTVQRSANSKDEHSIAEDSTAMLTLGNSIVTSDVQKANVVQEGGYRGQSIAMNQVAQGRESNIYNNSSSSNNYNYSNNSSSPVATTLPRANFTNTTATNKSGSTNTTTTMPAEDDPDFIEACRIQQRANRFLAHKQYKSAIEEYTAALFLIPDDPQLSSDLHLGRAHALNGSRRHESARNDAKLAINLYPRPAAYSTLAKSLFYMKDYKGAVQAFQDCIHLLPPGETLGLFDEAYHKKALAALEEEEASLLAAGIPEPPSPTVVPKLPPPRFVPREQAIQQPPSVPPMPKQWPQQLPSSPTAFKCGTERTVVFISESLGIKLNRGSDGIVRVLSVTPESPSSNIVRQGSISIGDVVREAAGVDMRRPITNLMWGDTVALIKMAPRPITLVLAPELSPIPQAVLEEQRKATTGTLQLKTPSPSSGDESVRESMERTMIDSSEQLSGDVETTENIEIGDDVVEEVLNSNVNEHDVDENDSEEESDDDVELNVEDAVIVEAHEVDGAPVDSTDVGVESQHVESKIEGIAPVDGSEVPPTLDREVSLRDVEERAVGGEILFGRDDKPSLSGWDNLRWMSYAGTRKLKHCQPVYKLVEEEQKQLFWSTTNKKYISRALLVYTEPKLMLVVCRPTSIPHVLELTGLEDASDLHGAPNNVLTSYWVVESAIDPTTCKFRLSPLTTPTSLYMGENTSPRERSCFQIVAPFGNVTLSAVKPRDDARNDERYYSDSVAFLETTATETAIVQLICSANSLFSQIGNRDVDLSWKHQIILGTLHSQAFHGSQKILDFVIDHIKKHAVDDDKDDVAKGRLPSRIVDALDENGRTPLYYACAYRMTPAVVSLVKAGAVVDTVFEPDGVTLAHVCAMNLDDKALSIVLSASNPSRLDPNAIDVHCRTPMYLAATEGRKAGGSRDAAAFKRCMNVLEGWGGQLMVDSILPLPHPLRTLSGQWCYEEVDVLLQFLPFRYPLPNVSQHDGMNADLSLSAMYGYPIHSALIRFHKLIISHTNINESVAEFSLIKLLKVLLEHGFEPNERIELKSDPVLADFFGFSPIQIVGLSAIKLEGSKTLIDPAVYVLLHTLIVKVANFLVSYGARLSIEPPPLQRLRRSVFSESTNDDSKSTLVNEADRSSLNISSNKALVDYLGGDNLAHSSKQYSNIRSVEATSFINLHADDKAPIEDSLQAGGSDERSCSICWKQFGKLTNRKHRCRVVRRHVCDECSSKRVMKDGKEHRITDGQFNLAKIDAVKAKSVAEEESAERDRITSLQNRKGSAHAKLDSLEDEANRESLFGGVLDKATNYMFGEESDSASSKVQGLSSQLGETRNALLERGQKLSSVEEKSAQMVNASADFAKMAKELRKKSEKSFFGF